MQVSNQELLIAINKILETLHTESMSLIGLTEKIAMGSKEAEPESSKRIYQTLIGQSQSHALIDKYVFEARQLIHQNINQGE